MSCMPKNFNEEVTGIEKETSTVAKSLPPFEYEAKKKKSLIVVWYKRETPSKRVSQ